MLTQVNKSYRRRVRVTLPFFSGDNDAIKTFICHPLNERHHNVVIQSYIKSIRKFGLAQDVRGIAAAMPSLGGGAPYLMLTYGSITRAIYICAEKYGSEENVKSTISNGLVLDVYDEDMPTDGGRFIRDFFNSFHKGAGISFLEILSSTMARDAEWKAHAMRNAIPLSRGGRGANSTEKKTREVAQ
jgi:hypothetical protein